ncbi:hypothetical protein GJ496_008208 [Pomphorhynchus laevis]|nr:hypothetical protein GJ496_008208 [Pomphorhynchus laevis]
MFVLLLITLVSRKFTLINCYYHNASPQPNSLLPQESKFFFSKLTANPCIPNPCENQGKCLITGVNKQACLCPAPFRGDLCQIQSYSNFKDCVCQTEKEICFYDLTNDDYYCDCDQQYAGSNCEHSTHPCIAGNYCNVNNTELCTLQGNTIACQCRYSFGGDNCDKDWQNPCATTSLSWTSVPYTTYRDPNGLNKYIACLGRQMIPKQCGKNQHYDSTTNRCVSSHVIQIENIEQCKHQIKGSNNTELTNPCVKGKCEDKSGKCNCFPGFTGKSCNVEVDPCSKHPCKQFPCIRGELNLFYCKCPNNFIDKGPCRNPVKNPCLNRIKGDTVEILWDRTYFALCFDKGIINMRQCPKSQRWMSSSRSCQHINQAAVRTKYFECMPNPCLNGGRCRPVENPEYSKLSIKSFQCDCQPGTDGPYCQFINDPCLDSPCGESGYCRRISSIRYICICGSNSNLISDQRCPDVNPNDITLNTHEGKEHPLLNSYMCQSNWSIPMTGLYRTSENIKGRILYIKCMFSSFNHKHPLLYYSSCIWPLSPVPDAHLQRRSNTNICYASINPTKEMHELMHPLIRYSSFLQNDFEFSSIMKSTTDTPNKNQQLIESRNASEHQLNKYAAPAYQLMLQYPLVFEFEQFGTLFNVSLKNLKYEKADDSLQLGKVNKHYRSLLSQIGLLFKPSISHRITSRYVVATIVICIILIFLTT